MIEIDSILFTSFQQMDQLQTLQTSHGDSEVSVSANLSTEVLFSYPKQEGKYLWVLYDFT